jgi:inositol phosphorylceramide mannosyltransferase catalytic subunit
VIPHIFHRIWLGPSPLPAEFATYAESWRAHHPDWQHRLWTEDDLPAGLRPEVYERLRVPAERSDVLRFELLRLFGGVYLDTDFECLDSIDRLLEGVDFFAAYYKGDRVNNAILGAAQGHPLVLRALREIRPRTTWGTVDKDGTGPFFVDRLVRDAGVTLFDRRLFYPSASERPAAVAFHHMARTWKDVAGLRKSVLLARERTAEAREELEGLESGSGLVDRRLLALRQGLRRTTRTAGRKAGRSAARLSERGTVLAAPIRPRLSRAPSAVGVTVPRLFHHVWLGTTPMGRRREAFLRSWRAGHPHWIIQLWTEDNLPSDLRPEIYDRLRAPAERADLLRLELLVRQGGVAVDADLVCRRPLERLIAGSHAFAARAVGGSPSMMLVGAAPEHPTMLEACERARPQEWHTYSHANTGSDALAAAVHHGRPLDLLPRAALFPTTARERRRAYAVHRGGIGSNADRKRLAAELADAEEELRRATALLERRRSRLAL